MNPALRASTKAIQTHGVIVSYTSKTPGVYDPSTGSTNTSTVVSSLKAYPKHQITNQYSFPDMIGKEVITFYITPGSVIPKVGDTVSYASKVYRVFSFDSRMFNSEVCLYRLNSVAV
jgi:hypothetical protein